MTTRAEVGLLICITAFAGALGLLLWVVYKYLIKGSEKLDEETKKLKK